MSEMSSLDTQAADQSAIPPEAPDHEQWEIHNVAYDIELDEEEEERKREKDEWNGIWVARDEEEYESESGSGSEERSGSETGSEDESDEESNESSDGEGEDEDDDDGGSDEEDDDRSDYGSEDGSDDEEDTGSDQGSEDGSDDEEDTESDLGSGDGSDSGIESDSDLDSDFDTDDEGDLGVKDQDYVYVAHENEEDEARDGKEYAEEEEDVRERRVNESESKSGTPESSRRSLPTSITVISTSISDPNMATRQTVIARKPLPPLPTLDSSSTHPYSPSESQSEDVVINNPYDLESPMPITKSKRKARLLRLANKATSAATTAISTTAIKTRSSAVKERVTVACTPSTPPVPAYDDYYACDITPPVVLPRSYNSLPTATKPSPLLRSVLTASVAAATASFLGDNFAQQLHTRKTMILVGKAKGGMPGLAVGVAKAVVVGGVEGGKVIMKDGGKKKIKNGEE